MVQNAGGSPKETVRDCYVSTRHVWERYAGHTDPRRSQIRNSIKRPVSETLPQYESNGGGDGLDMLSGKTRIASQELH